ncbi:hypothetical protein JCM10212_003017 [Sporobolomyces blumeae]
MSRSPPSPCPPSRRPPAARHLWPTPSESLASHPRPTEPLDPLEATRFVSSRSTDFLLEPPTEPSSSPLASQPTTPTPGFPYGSSSSDSAQPRLVSPSLEASSSTPAPPTTSASSLTVPRAGSAPYDALEAPLPLASCRSSRDDPTLAFRGSPQPFFMPDLTAIASQGPSHDVGGGSLSVNSGETARPSRHLADQGVSDPYKSREGAEERGRERAREANETEREHEGRESETIEGSRRGPAWVSARVDQVEADLSQLADLAVSLHSKVQELVNTVQVLYNRLCVLERAVVTRDQDYEALKSVVDALARRLQRDDNIARLQAHQGLYQNMPSEPYLAELTPPGTAPYLASSSEGDPPSQFSEDSIPLLHRRTISLPVHGTSGPPPLVHQPSPHSFTPPGYLQFSPVDHPSASQIPPSHGIPGGVSYRSYAPLSGPYVLGGPTPPTSFHRHTLSSPAAVPYPTSGAPFDVPGSAGSVPRRPAVHPLQGRGTTGSSGGGAEWVGQTGSGGSGRSRSGSEVFACSRPGVAGSTIAGPFVGSAGRMAREEPVNYRNLLETDENIDEEAFVQRIYMQNDQQCSLFLQQRVRTTTSEGRQRLFQAVGNHLLEMSMSKFGNFLVSRCLEAGDLALAQKYSAKLYNHFLDLSLDSFGCHVVQKILDCSDKATKERVIDELTPFPNTLMQKNSAHVWNRLLTQPNPPAFYRRLAEMGKGIWSGVVKDDGGSLIVQHMVEDWLETHTSVVARELLEGLEGVATTACGSFVLAAFIEKNALPFRARVLELAPRLATDTFGAKVVERVLKTGRPPPAAIGAFVEAITTVHEAVPGPLLLPIASHVSGSSLLAYLLTSSVAAYSDRAKLVRCIAAYQGQLVAEGGAHACKLVALIEKPATVGGT